MAVVNGMGSSRTISTRLWQRCRRPSWLVAQGEQKGSSIVTMRTTLRTLRKERNQSINQSTNQTINKETNK